MADLATQLRHIRAAQKLRPLELLAQEVRDAPPTDEIGWLARRLAGHAFDAGRSIASGAYGDLNGDVERVAHYARELDLALVVLAPVDDLQHPAWDLLLRWRDAVAKAELGR